MGLNAHLSMVYLYANLNMVPLTSYVEYFETSYFIYSIPHEPISPFAQFSQPALNILNSDWYQWEISVQSILCMLTMPTQEHGGTYFSVNTGIHC